ncbi:hypothetical protein [Bacillus sp. SG-1]|uniref:hypothetical protein n=1 Tax=Bacillus sp. SG-1 TaxID=161544 RepID=UPI0005C44280|nr:hypothetical protein [Bacillus sp. SG-1]
MKRFFSRYSHWLLLFITGFSFITMFINFNPTQLSITAVIMGGLGVLAVGYLAFIVEKKIRDQK